MSERIPAEMWHPAVFIQEEMDARGWTARDAATRMSGDFGTNLLALEMYLAVPNDKCRIGDFAKELGEAFGVSEQFFRNMEEAYVKWAEHRAMMEIDKA